MKTRILCPEKQAQGYLHIDVEARPCEDPKATAVAMTFFDAIDIGTFPAEELSDGYVEPAESAALVAKLTAAKTLVDPADGGVDPDRTVSGHIHGQMASIAQSMAHAASEVAALGSHAESEYQARYSQSLIEELATMAERSQLLHERIKGFREDYVARQMADLELPTPLRVHFGVPRLRRLDGWLNIEPFAPAQLALSTRWPLPLADDTAACAYSAHTLEHLWYKSELLPWLREIRRVLTEGSWLRIVVPDLEVLIRAYAADDDEFFAARSLLKHFHFTSIFRSKLDNLMRYFGAGIRPWNFYGHKYGYDFDTLADVLREAGFRKVLKSRYMESEDENLRVDDQCTGAQQTVGDRYLSLFVEAQK